MARAVTSAGEETGAVWSDSRQGRARDGPGMSQGGLVVGEKWGLGACKVSVFLWGHDARSVQHFADKGNGVVSPQVDAPCREAGYINKKPR